MTKSVELNVALDLESHLLQPTTPEEGEDAVLFEGIAVSPGTYTANQGLQIHITEEVLPLIAERLAGVQIRDLHEERVVATVGAVQQAWVENQHVAFEGAVGIEPHASIVRRFPETIRFSVGFRFTRDDLEVNEENVAPLPESFFIDHLALVGQGQDPSARLIELLNQAHTGHDERDGITVDKDTLAELRRQRDDALEAEKQARADLAKAESRLETTNEKLDLAEQTQHEAETNAEKAQADADAARLELERAKATFATSILKLELKAGEDIDLHERQQDLLDMELSELDELRLELAEDLAERLELDDESEEGPATGADAPANPHAANGDGTAKVELSELSLKDTVKLGLMREAL